MSICPKHTVHVTVGWFTGPKIQKSAPLKHLIFDYIGEWFKNIGTFIGFLRSGTFFWAKF